MLHEVTNEVTPHKGAATKQSLVWQKLWSFCHIDWHLKLHSKMWVYYLDDKPMACTFIPHYDSFDCHPRLRSVTTTLYPVNSSKFSLDVNEVKTLLHKRP